MQHIRGFRPNWLTAALALVLIVATGIGIQAVRSHAGDPQVDVATPLPFHALPTRTPFIPTPGTPYGFDQDGTPVPLPPELTPTPTIANTASTVLAQLTQQSPLIASVTMGQEVVEVEDRNGGIYATVWDATFTQIAQRHGPLLLAPYTNTHTIQIAFFNGHQDGNFNPVNDGPLFHPGEQDVLFLQRAMVDVCSTACYQITGSGMGRFLVTSPGGTLTAADASFATSRYDGDTPAQLFAQLPH